MEKSNELDQLTNTPATESDTSFVSSTDREAALQESEQSSYGNLWAAIETGLIIVGLVLVALLLPHQVNGDGIDRYNNLSSLWLNHSLTQPPGKLKFSLIGPFFSSPLFLIGEILGHPKEWTGFYNLTLFAFCLLFSYFLLRNQVDRAVLRKFFLMLIYGSMFVAHLSFYYGEVFTALFVGFGVLIAFVRLTSIGGWLVIILGVVNTPATLAGLGLLVVKKMFDSRCLRYVFVFALAAICILMESWVRRGHIFDTGYETEVSPKNIMPFSGLPGFTYPLFFGLLSILFSFGEGLVFFAPGLLLPIRKTLLKWPQHQRIDLYQIYVLWMCFLIGVILVYCRWYDWSGSLFWGPRYFLFASIPASFALAMRLRYYKEASLGVNLWTLVVFCLSAWVNVDGAVFQLVAVDPTACAQNNHALIMLCWYTPEYSALWTPFVLHLQVDREQIFFLVFSLLAAAYLVAPLFIHLLKQIWDVVKTYSSYCLDLKLWRI